MWHLSYDINEARSHPQETEGMAAQAEEERERRPLGGDEFGFTQKLQQGPGLENWWGKVVASGGWPSNVYITTDEVKRGWFLSYVWWDIKISQFQWNMHSDTLASSYRKKKEAMQAGFPSFIDILLFYSMYKFKMYNIMTWRAYIVNDY